MNSVLYDAPLAIELAKAPRNEEAHGCGTHHYQRTRNRLAHSQLSHLGSDIVAECWTRPQYVLRSYWETGRSRLPGSEDVILCEGEGVKQQWLLRARTSFGGLGMAARVGKWSRYDIR